MCLKLEYLHIKKLVLHVDGRLYEYMYGTFWPFSTFWKAGIGNQYNKTISDHDDFKIPFTYMYIHITMTFQFISMKLSYALSIQHVFVM